jgi:VCBS repeat-containing protein
VFRGTCDAPGEGGAIGGCAQLMGALPPQAIGKVQTATGQVTVTGASGVVAQVKVGDPVYRHDTIETGLDGAVAITFTDGTAFNLSNNARMVLNEFVCDGTSNSALFSLSKGVFAFIAGKVAKTGGLKIDTPFARIRGAAQEGGICILTLAALAFSTIREIQAASRSDAFLDDGTITYKDSPHGTFEITTRDGRVIVADDPGETIVVDPAGSVTRMPNSSSRMAELQVAQQNTLSTLSLGLGQQGAAPGGSSTPTFNIPLQLQPINFSQPQNQNPAPLTVTINATPTTQGILDFSPPQPPPPVTPPNPELEPDVSGTRAIIEVLNTTGSTNLDIASAGELTFTHFNVSTVGASLASITWSGGATLPSGLSAVLASALTTSVSSDSTTGSSGSIVTTFSAPDRNFDFLAAGETLTITYNVTVTDNVGVSLIQPVTITVTGSNDAPVLAADASGPHTTTQDVNISGSLTFTDVDLSDHHTVSTSVASTTWSGGATLPSAIDAVLAGALSVTVVDSTGSGSGSIAFTFGAVNALDFLAAGEKFTITYNVTVTDNNGLSSTQPVTITIIGTNDAPVLAVDASGPHTITKHVPITGSTSLDTSSGTLTFTDVDLSDTHKSITSTPTFAWSGGTLTAAQQAALAAASTLTLSENDSTGSGVGSIAFSYSAADKIFDFLAFGQTLTITYNVTVTDNIGVSSTKPVIITVIGADVAPVLSNVAATASYAAVDSNPPSSTPVTLSSASTVSDVDDQTLQSAKVTISSGFLTGDVLSANVAGTSITASYDPTTGVLTLTGNDTLVHYRQVLDNVTYNSTSSNPTNFGADTSRTISWVVNDGTLNSAPQTTTLTITAQDAAPALGNVAPTASYAAVDSNPASSTPVTLSSALTVSDVDDQTLQSAKVTISSGFLTGDVLAFTNTSSTTYGNITASYDATHGVLTLTSAGATATLLQWRAALDAVQYSSISTNPTNFGNDTSRTITWVVNDGTLNSATATTTLTIAAQDAAPVLSNVAPTASYAAEPNPASSTPVTLSSAATVSDVDSQTLKSATVSISSGFFAGDVLSANVAGTSITASYNAATGVLTLTGSDTLAHYTQVLDTVTYNSTSSNPTNFGADTSRTISWVVNDGTLNSAPQTTTVTIAPDFLTIPAGQTVTLNGGTLQALFIDVEGTVTGFGTIIANVITNNGTIQSKSNHTLTIEISGSIQGTGLLEITNNTTLALDGPVGSGQTVQFDIGNGPAPNLILNDPSHFQGQISGFQGTDTIDLPTIHFDSGTTATFSGGILTIKEGTTTVAALTFVGSPNLKIASDGHGGTLITDPPPSTTTPDATVTPVAQTPTLIATEAMGAQKNVTLATVDEATAVALNTAVAVALNTAVADPDGGKMSSLTLSGDGTAGDITDAGSGSYSSMVNSGTAAELNPISHSIAGTLADSATVDVINGKPAGAVSGPGALKIDAGATPQLNGSHAVNVTFAGSTGGTNTDAINLPENHTITTTRHVSDGSHGGTSVGDPPTSAAGEDSSAPSTSADNHVIVSSPLTEPLSGNGDHSAFLFKPNVDHPAIADPDINLVSMARDHLPLQHPADNLLHMPARLDDNMSDGAQPPHPHSDVNQSGSFKFADDGSAHPAHVIGEDTSVQSTPADNGNHTIADSEINLASIAPNHLPEHPADNSLHMPAQLDGNGVLTVTDGAHPADLPVDVNQLPSFKFVDDGSTDSAHATSKDASSQSTLADNGHAIADPEINLASIAPNHLPGHPADNSLHMPAQLDGNSVFTGTDRAHPVDLPVDVNQLPSFKFPPDGSTHPGTVTYGQPTLTALSGDLSGDHGPAAPALAKTFNVPGTVMSDAASDKFIFGQGFDHNTIADHKPDMTEIDHTVPAAIQHLLDTAHDTNAVSALDPNHATALQDMTKVQLPHHQGDFHFA